MSVDTVRTYLSQYDFADRILEFDVSSATVELAAEAVGCEPGMIAKSLTFLVDDKAVMIIAAGDMKIDNAKYKAFFHTKAKMLTPDQVVDMIGHAVGGVCPFAVKEGVSVYLDESLKRFETVYPAAGSSNSAVRLSIADLEQCSGYLQWIDVCKLTDLQI